MGQLAVLELVSGRQDSLSVENESQSLVFATPFEAGKNRKVSFSAETRVTEKEKQVNFSKRFDYIT